MSVNKYERVRDQDFEIKKPDTAVMFDRDNEYVLVELSKNYPSYIGARYSEAKCSANDCFSLTIGRMVALCKATGTRLPDWI